MQQSSEITIGLDVGDKHSQVCIIDSTGDTIEETRIPTTVKGIQRYFSSKSPATVTLEVGTHSPWISRALKEAGHVVIVANARKVRLIYGSTRKNDRLDAEKLARLTRHDVKLLATNRASQRSGSGSPGLHPFPGCSGQDPHFPGRACAWQRESIRQAPAIR